MTELAKEKRGHFLYPLFSPKEMFLTFVFYLNVYTFKIYMLLDTKKKITSYTFLFKVVKSLQCVSLSWIYLDDVEEGDEMIKTLDTIQ